MVRFILPAKVQFLVRVNLLDNNPPPKKIFTLSLACGNTKNSDTEELANHSIIEKKKTKERKKHQEFVYLWKFLARNNVFIFWNVLFQKHDPSRSRMCSSMSTAISVCHVCISETVALLKIGLHKDRCLHCVLSVLW